MTRSCQAQRYCRGVRKIVATLALAILFPAFASAQFHFQFDEGQRAWTLTNGSIEAVFQLTPSDTFELVRLANVHTGDAWQPPEQSSTSPIRLQVDDTVLDAGTRFRLVNQSARSIPRRGYRQTITLEDAGGLGRVILELEMFEGQPVLRYRTRFKNLQPSTVRVSMADMLPWTFDSGGKTFRSFRVNQWVKGGTLGNFETFASTLDAGGHPAAVESGAYGQHCGWLAVRDQSNRGLFAGWEFDGRASASVRHYRDRGTIEFAASVLDLSHPVAPEEEFTVPAAFLGLFHGDWDEAGYRTQRFSAPAIAKPLPGSSFPYVAWDSWRYQQDLDETTLRRNAEIAADLGIELFVIDLGWARRIGDWYADPQKFPSGLRALSDYVHSLGMKFGLHFALAEAAPDSPVLEANPDWTSSESYGYFDALSLCLSHQPVREWIVEQAVRMIDDYNVDWILQDGENMVKRCTKTTHTHAPLDSNYSNSVDGITAVVAEIQKRRPKVVWENCEDGGNMMTFSMVRNYATSIAADDSGPMTTRQAIYGITYPFSPRYSDRYMADEDLDRYITRSYMFGGPWVFMNRLPLLRPEDLELARSEIAIYKSIRARIRDGKVFHLTARPAEDRIDAMESYHAQSGSAIIFIMRPEAADDFYMLHPRGLAPETSYQVRFEESGRTLTMTGAQITGSGLRVELPGMWATEIVFIDPLAETGQ